MDTFICTMKTLVDPLHTPVELLSFFEKEANCANFLVLCRTQGAQRPHSGTVEMRCIFIVRRTQGQHFFYGGYYCDLFTTMFVLVFLSTLWTLIDFESRAWLLLFKLVCTRAKTCDVPVNKI